MTEPGRHRPFPAAGVAPRCKEFRQANPNERRREVAIVPDAVHHPPSARRAEGTLATGAIGRAPRRWERLGWL